MRADKLKRSCVRVKTGCSTCKYVQPLFTRSNLILTISRVRRVKCDEKKPSCLRCTYTGRKCDGYSITSSRNHLPEATLNGQSKLAARVPLETSSFYSVPFQIPGSQSDRQLFHYFCVHASSDLAGFSPACLDFWGKLVVQCSHHELVVRSILIAVASVHRSFAAEDDLGSGFINAMKEYNKAIRRLRKYMRSRETPNRKLVLMCCALFYCFESIRGEQEWALHHLKAGLKILNEAAGPIIDKNELDELEPVKEFFSRLDIQVAIFEDGQLPLLRLISPDEKSGLVSCVPPSFTSFSKAEISLNKLENWIIHFLISNQQHKSQTQIQMPQVVTQEIQELTEQLKGWEQAFSVLVTNQTPPSDKERAQTLQNSISISKIQLRCYQIALLSFCPVTDADLANARDVFDDILVEISNVLSRQSSGSNPYLRSFSCDSSIVLSLFFISCKCRDAQTRQQALSLLAGTNRREGVWDAQVMGEIVKGIMELELNGARFPAEENGLSVEDWAAENFIGLNGGFHTMAGALNVTKVCL